LHHAAGYGEQEGCSMAKGGETYMSFSIYHVQPVAALIAGILILFMPKLLNYIVAVYLILIGIIGLIH
jgi:hypothetical protein